MQGLFDLIFQNHPKFADEIEGLPEERIKMLESRSHLSEFPKDYRTFLKIMGLNTGRVKVFQRGKSQLSPGKYHDYKYEIQVDFNSIFKEYKLNPKSMKTGYDGIFSWPEVKGEPKNYLLFGVNTQGNDNGHFFLDLRTENLKVVEICETRGILERSRSLAEFLFNDYFRRETSTYLHNKQWLT